MNQKEDNFVIALVEDRIRKAEKTQYAQYTTFLDPLQQIKVENIILKNTDICGVWDGGYRRAERKIVTILPAHFANEKTIQPIVTLEITWDIRFSEIAHRDALGAILGLGIERSCIGDIIIQDKKAYVIVLREMADFIQLNLLNIGRVPVRIKNVNQMDDIDIKQTVKEINSYVCSARLDTIIGLGLEISRTKVIPLIHKGLVQVNWENKLKPDTEIKTEDMISVRGKGRIQVKEIGGKTKKGRINISIIRFL